jgi:hypothetical protein
VPAVAALIATERPSPAEARDREDIATRAELRVLRHRLRSFVVPAGRRSMIAGHGLRWLPCCEHPQGDITAFMIAARGWKWLQR